MEHCLEASFLQWEYKYKYQRTGPQLILYYTGVTWTNSTATASFKEEFESYIGCQKFCNRILLQILHVISNFQTHTMGSAKQDVAIAQVMNLLSEWDKGSKSVRRRILQDFIAQNQNKTGPELEAIFAQAASLFLTRLTAWLRLTYPLSLVSTINDVVDGECRCVLTSLVIMCTEIKFSFML